MYEENVELSGELIGGIRAMRKVISLMHVKNEVTDVGIASLSMMLDDIENDALNVVEKLLLN